MSENATAITPAEKSFNQRLIEEFRANGGKVSGRFANVPLLLMTTIGAKTGRPRTIPVAYVPDDGRYVFTAAKEENSPTRPDWYHNLRANPNITVEVGTETFAARAILPEGAERQRLFDRYAAQLSPQFAHFLRNTHFEIPMVVLERVG